MVLILDNNNNRANGLSAALNFVGQPAQMVSESDFQKEMSKTKDAIVVLGALAELDHEQVIKSAPASPFLLIGETLKPLLDLANVIGLISEPFIHDVTMQLLHDAQQYLRMLPNKADATAGKSFDGLVGETVAVKQVRFLISQVAKTDANVLILGESGTGK